MTRGRRGMELAAEVAELGLTAAVLWLHVQVVVFIVILLFLFLIFFFGMKDLKETQINSDEGLRSRCGGRK